MQQLSLSGSLSDLVESCLLKPRGVLVETRLGPEAARVWCLHNELLDLEHVYFFLPML